MPFSAQMPIPHSGAHMVMTEQMLRCQFVTAGDLGNHRPKRYCLGNDPSLVLVRPTPPTAHASADINTAASRFEYIFDHIYKTIPPNQQPSFAPRSDVRKVWSPQRLPLSRWTGSLFRGRF
jgi:hypothetical protein